MSMLNKEKSKPDLEQINRRKALKKAGFYALSAASLMVIMNTQAKAQSSPAPPPSGFGFD